MELRLTVEILQFDFMVRALIGASLVGLTAPSVGIYLVQRRLALIGDGMGHVALTGVAIGVFTGTAPVLTALACSVAGAVAIELARLRGRSTADVLLAVLLYGGIAGGVVLIGASPQGTTANLTTYLFGSIITTTPSDLIVFAVLSLAVLAVTVGLAPRLFTVSNDEEFAQASGLNVAATNVLLAVLTAATVVISMRVVGLLLISALMIVPNAVAQQLASSFRTSLVTAIVVGVTVSITGTAGSYYADTPPGGTIVLLAIAVFLLATVGARIRRTMRVRHNHLAADHPHQHGPGCGHRAIQHGDHVDYLHDGHRHAVHGAHYDDH